MDNSFEQIEYHTTCPNCGAVSSNKEKCDYCGASLIKSVTKGYLNRFQSESEANMDYSYLFSDSLMGNQPKKKKQIVPFAMFIAIIMMVIVTILGMYLVNTQRKKMNEMSQAFDEVSSSAERSNEVDRTMFNSMYEFYEGYQDGFTISFMLDNVIKTGSNEDHIMYVSFGEINSSEKSEIRKISDSLDSFKKYEVSFGYDSEGYVNKVIIK